MKGTFSQNIERKQRIFLTNNY